MKKTLKVAALALMVSVAAVSCKKKVSDADLTVQATKVVVANPKASVEVKEGVAHLSGTFASQEEKDAMIAELKKVEGVKDVMDMATVEAAAPVVETVSAVAPEVVQKVTDALKDFPGVKADVVNGVLTLTGNASPEQARKIKMSIDALKIGKYDNKLTVK